MSILTYTNPKHFIIFGLDIIKLRNYIFDFAKNDFKQKYVGSYFGIFWAFFQPLMNILVIWFVFSMGFKSGASDKVPFILWFIAGYVPWVFFTEVVFTSSLSIVEYSYIVKKIVFRISILPIIKIVSGLFIHLFFIAFLFFIYYLYGFYPHLYNFQLLYYMVALCFFILGLSFLTSSIVPFFKDFSQLINIVLQMGFWFTPIVWSYTNLSGNALLIIKLNPMFYIIEGYRNSMIDNIMFWEKPEQTIYFWIITILLWIIGSIFFRKLKPHFADVL